MAYSIVLWDWNGTLLDDVDLCIDSMNNMLSKRSLGRVNIEKYKQIFGFPVKDYYISLGFDFSKDSFEDLSVEFIKGYNARIENASLHKFTLEALRFFKNKNVWQGIVSAMEQNMLNNLINKHNISGFFDDIRGISNIYAEGKIQIARNFMEEKKFLPSEVLFVGDTLHDAEVAKEIGVDCVLVSNGHHSYERLASNGNKVIGNLQELINSLN